MAVLIGHASIDENGKARGGTAGDQTKREVCTRNWYGNWTSAIRAKSDADAEEIARAMEQACANDCIGYDQNQRTTLYAQAKANNWDLSKIKAKCECDCSSLVAVCVNAAGIAVSKDIYTGNELSALKATGKFDVFTSADYVKSEKKLKRGDILLRNGHTAIALSDGEDAEEKKENTVPATGTYFKRYTGSSCSIVTALNSIGENSSFAYRKTIAVANGIANYSGTAAQNTLMVNRIKRGELLKPVAVKNEPVTPQVTYFKKYTGTSGSIVATLNSIGATSSYEYRKTIAVANGITGYTGTATQNTKMVNLLKQGKLIKP